MPGFSFAGTDLGGSRMAINPDDIREGILIEQELEGFVWGLEISREGEYGSDLHSISLCVKIKNAKSPKETFVVGQVFCLEC